METSELRSNGRRAPRFVEDNSAVHVLETQTMLLRCTPHLRSELARTIHPNKTSCQPTQKSHSS